MPIPEFPKVVSNLYPKSAGKEIPKPSRSFNEGIKSNTVIFSADSGHEQRRQRSLPKRTFQLSWLVLTADQYKTIRDFYLLVQNVKSFSWTHPIEDTSFTVKFTNDTFSGENFSHSPIFGPLYKLQLSIEQTWD